MKKWCSLGSHPVHADMTVQLEVAAAVGMVQVCRVELLLELYLIRCQTAADLATTPSSHHWDYAVVSLGQRVLQEVHSLAQLVHCSLERAHLICQDERSSAQSCCL